MNIQVRIVTAEAQARIKQLERQLNQLNGGMGRLGGGTRGVESGFARAMTAGTKFGNQLQWTGRQLQYNFAMPIALAAGAATKFALDNEAAMVRVTKVYGNAGQTAADFGGEIKALERNFEALSNHFGVNRAEVINLAADWAAAGATGIALAKATKLTLETMVLGEMSASESMQALLAIQGQYNLSIDELSKSMDTLNMIENETDVSMKDLIVSMARSAGTARQAGVTVQELAAMTAALVPEAANASTAGNGLKTIISRLLSPTEDAAVVLGKMGLSMNDVGWQSQTVTQRLQTLADAFVKLPEGQRAVVGEYVAGRFQITRFNQAMVDIADTAGGDYHKAMNASADATANYRQRVRELNAVLSSNPQKMKQVKVILQNTLTDAIVPLLPAIVYLAQQVTRLFQAFQNLDPRLQTIIGGFLLFLMLFGPLVRYLGSTITLFVTLGDGMRYAAGKALLLFGRLFLLVRLPFMPFIKGAQLATAAVAGLGGVSGIVGGGMRLLFRGLLLGAITMTTGLFAVFGALVMGLGRLFPMTMVRQVFMATLQYFLMATAGFGTAVRTLWVGLWIGVQTAAVEIWAGMRMLWARFLVVWEIMTTTFGVVMREIWIAMHTGLGAATVAFNFAFQKLWKNFLWSIQYMTRGFAIAMPIIWRGMQAMIYTLTIGFKAAMISAYRLMQVGIMTSMFALRAGMMGVFASMRALPLMLIGGFRVLPMLFMRLSGLITAAFIRVGPMIFRALTSWQGLLVMALLGIAYHFRDQIAQIWSSIVSGFSQFIGNFAGVFTPLVDFFDRAVGFIEDAFWRLPKSVRDVFLAVVQVIKAAAMAVYNLFSYLNPWAHHSPSLVESVTSGADAIMAQYSRMGGAGAMFLKAAKDLATFKRIASNLGIDEWSSMRVDIAENLPAVLPIFNVLVKDIHDLTPLMNEQSDAVDAQQKVVDNWKNKLDDANDALDAQQKLLDRAKDSLSNLKDEYDKHEKAMQDFASAPIKGMGEMSDAIFENQMAQKKLQLQMMQWEDANGTIEDLKSRFASLQGDIETATSEASTLRAAGAGTDILGPITDQIAAMEAQAAATQKTLKDSPVAQMQKDLDALDRKGQMLDLQNSINFDPMLREIDKLANAQKELSYDAIIKGITDERNAMDTLQPKIDAATAAVDKQQAAVDKATDARDALQDSYDIEAGKLDVLKEAYQKTADTVHDLESALRDLNSAQSAANKLKGPEPPYSATKFDAAAAADFADVGGSGNVPREFPEIADQSKMIDDLTKQLTLDTASMFGKFDMLGPIKDAWNKAWTWVKENVGPYVGPVVTGIQTAWNDLSDWFRSSAPNWHLGEKAGAAFDEIRKPFDKVFGWLRGLWNLIAPDVKRVLDNLIIAVKNIWTSLGPELEKWGALFKPLMEAVVNVFEFLKPYLTIALGAILLIVKIGFSILGHVIGPILDTVVSVITNALQAIRGVIELVLGIINGDWSLAWQGIKDIVAGVFGVIWALIWGRFKLILGFIEGVIGGIIGFFKWLYDELVGHSIIPDLVDAIWKIIKGLGTLGKWVWDHVLKPVVDFFVDLTRLALAEIRFVVANIWTILKALWALGTWVWNNILKPVVDLFKNLWEGNLKGALNSLITLITNVWHGLWGLPAAIWDNVLKPIIGHFGDLWDSGLKPIFNRLLRGIGNIWNAVGEGIAAGVNVGISAINKLIEAINWVGSHVPGLSFSISTLGKVTFQKWTPPQFATGGVLPSRVGEGFATNGARAIVGEGGRHPEYVIPTDPKHRKNALKLYGDLGKAIGGWGPVKVPHIDPGAVLDKAKDLAGDAASAVRKGGVIAAFAGPLKAFDTIMKAMGDRPQGMKATIMKMKNDVYNWAKGVDSQLPTTPPPGTFGADGITGNTWQDIDKWLTAHGNVARSITSTVRPGDTGYHGLGRAVDFSVAGHNNAGYNAPGLKKIFDALLPIGGNLAELILAGAPFNVKNGQKVPGYAWGQPGQPGNHWNHVHAALENGGITKSGRPIKALIGEGRDRELITPLTPLWNRLDRIEAQTAQQGRGGGDTVINFYGDLSFPNITDGSDAETFIRNLETVARR